MDRTDSLEKALAELVRLYDKATNSQNWLALAHIREVYSLMEARYNEKSDNVRLSLDKHEDDSHFGSRT